MLFTGWGLSGVISCSGHKGSALGNILRLGGTLINAACTY